MGINKKAIALAFRDGINRATGKQSWIEKYSDAMAKLSKKSDSLQGEQKRDLLDQLHKIDEEQWIKNDNSNSITIQSFNPYSLKTSKSSIKAKVAALEQLMQKYNVK